MEPVTKIFTIQIETPDGRLPPAQAEVPDVPLGLADLVAPAYEFCDGVVALAARKAGESGEKISCRAGCGACCRQLVPVSAPEAFFLVRETLASGDERTLLFKQHFSDLRARLIDNGLWNRLEKIGSENNQSRVAAEYWNQELACPFLLNESCGIHAQRPCACREYNVTNAPGFCARPLAANIKRITIHRKMTTALAKTAASLVSAPPILIPLATIPHWCERNAAIGRMRWNGVELFNRMLDFALRG
jgi:Fe-S-cluster containining protein